MEGSTQLQISVPAAFGSSGSPVLNELGQAVGLVTSGYSGEEYNFAVPSNYIAGMLGEVKDLPAEVLHGMGQTLAPLSEPDRVEVEEQPEVVEEQPEVVEEQPEVVEEQPEVEADLGEDPAYDISQIRRIGLITFTSDGAPDSFGTAMFIKLFREKIAGYELVDPYELKSVTDSQTDFHSEMELKPILAMARESGVQAVMLGVGKGYNLGFRFETRLIEINRGRVLWTTAKASGIAFTGPRAKSKVFRKVLRALKREALKK
jgi:hypothetical protein